ncbi:MAG: DNA mismatch repair protein MutS [Proteobacteria bacterium]|nr:DNA mismatch repair protein MutS [Desulfobacula sp.]MBU3954638.1 DNA mismatch repair protein MutS [Pseudomonadota bacterium]MBU4130088.1 DNA mismatch repair protein MutS [Pseudomonadota bacterium]
MKKFPGEKMLVKVEPLIISNDRKTFIKHGRQNKPAKVSRQLYLQLCPIGVVDKETLKLVQVLELHRAVDHTFSATGSAALLRSLVQPGTDLQFIRSKQASLSEIASDDTLRHLLQDYVHEFSKGESALYNFFNKGLRASFPYPAIKRARQSALNMSRMIQALPRSESSYLGALISHLYAYKGSSIDQMMNGLIYKTFTGLKPENEVGFFTPKLRFRPRRFTEWLFAGPLVAAAPYLQDKIGPGLSISPLMLKIGLAWTGGYAFYSMFVKPVNDTEKFIEPLRKKCVYDNRFNQAVDAIGMIDELLSCHAFARKSLHAAVMPRVADEPHHFFEATGLKNPVLAKENREFVPNNIQMNGSRLTFLSGPNSGGKTTICKSIVLSQLLAQAGFYVLAEKASINIADKIHYQAPKFDSLQDEEGRFGTELSRTRDIFYSTTPKSLVILDELAEGTTYEERQNESFGILSDFCTIGNNTLLVTHNHSLVDRFIDDKTGQCLMAEFDEDMPTYRIIPGISRVSHADKVAKRINFSNKDRHRYMKEKGFL